jgi:CRP-like cAMP-binding protein
MEAELFSFISTYMPLQEDEKKALTELDIVKSFAKGTVLLKEGQLSDDGYFILKGGLRCFYIVDGEEKTTAFYTEYESLSPMCTIDGKPSGHYVSCMEDSVIIVSNSAMEKAIFAKFPRFETLCRILSEKLLAENKASFDQFRISSPEERYLSLLRDRPDLVQRVPQYQMASYLGITPQSLSRMRSRLAKKQ